MEEKRTSGAVMYATRYDLISILFHGIASHTHKHFKFYSFYSPFKVNILCYNIFIRKELYSWWITDTILTLGKVSSVSL